MPVPSVVLLLAVVGEALVLQQTPRAVTVAPPSEVIFPPLLAVVATIALAFVVVSVGSVAELVKLTCAP